ncbi:MAG: class I SAM-dependent methyltransferase [Acidobacteria bacterium]|jgi:SAM-dependent methyltransferase|nr:class I SAM-dependent methyltransferase [Acidobacteriota bacterium]
MTVWDARYERGFIYGEAPNDFLVEHEPVMTRGARVLCLAEGQGRNAVFLASRGHHVTGVDTSEVGLAHARDLAARQGVSIVTVAADLADFDLGAGCWDAIVSIWCHLPAALRLSVHRRCVAALADDGVFLLEAYRPAQLEFGTGGPPDAALLYTLDQLASDLEGLTIEHGVETQRDVQEGILHRGPSAVVQVVAHRRRGHTREA